METHPRHRNQKRRERNFPPKKSAYCGQELIPTSPAQKFCSPKGNPVCDGERFFASLAPCAFIRFHGYRNKKQFIKEQREGARAAIQ